jgi:hypothetical protein
MRAIATWLFFCLMLALGVVNVWAAQTSDLTSSGRTLLLTDPNGPAKFLCVPERPVAGKTVKLICVAGDVIDLKPVASQQPARNNAEIMRGLYNEKDETPFWK